MTPDQIFAEFQRRKKLQRRFSLFWFLAVAVFILVVGVFISDQNTKLFLILGFGGIASVAMLIFSLKNWCCPVCKQAFGRPAPKKCPSCGAVLEF
jgi:hypothetical protein